MLSEGLYIRSKLFNQAPSLDHLMISNSVDFPKFRIFDVIYTTYLVAYASLFFPDYDMNHKSI